MSPVPLYVIVVGSAFWTFWVAMRYPHLLGRTPTGRAVRSIAEGAVWAAAWGVVYGLLHGLTAGELLFYGLQLILAWTIPAFVSRSRYRATEEKYPQEMDRVGDYR